MSVVLFLLWKKKRTLTNKRTKVFVIGVGKTPLISVCMKMIVITTKFLFVKNAMRKAMNKNHFELFKKQLKEALVPSKD